MNDNKIIKVIYDIQYYSIPVYNIPIIVFFFFFIKNVTCSYGQLLQFIPVLKFVITRRYIYELYIRLIFIYIIWF